MRTTLLFSCLFGLLVFSGWTDNPVEDRVAIRGSWFFVDGERFFIKGIAYSGQRPGQSPGQDRINRNHIVRDFAMIQEAGFNTVRVWTQQQVKIAAEYGLMVIYEVWVDQERPLDTDHLREVQARIAEDIPAVLKQDNLLMINIFNEPRQNQVLGQTESQVQHFFKSLVDAIKKLNPNVPVSMAQWNPIAYMNQDLWDATCFNTYYHSPITNAYSCGPRSYVHKLIQRDQITHPFINSEHSVLVSPTPVGEKFGRYSYGGNKPVDQGTGTIELAAELIGGGVTGHIVLHFIDAWWLKGTPNTQDDHPEEHLGITRIGTNGEAVPKPAYADIKQYNQAVLAEPRKYRLYHPENQIPVAVTVTGAVSQVQARLDKHKPVRMLRTGNHWFEGRLRLQPGAHHVSIKALDRENRVIEKKSVTFFVTTDPKDYHFDIALEHRPDNTFQIQVQARDPHGSPMPNKKVRLSVFYAETWQELKFSEVTDAQGRVTIDQPARNKPFFIEVGAGMEVERYGQPYWAGGFYNERIDV